MITKTGKISKKSLEAFYREIEDRYGIGEGKDSPIEHQIRWVPDRYLDISGETSEHPELVLKGARKKFCTASGTSFYPWKVKHLVKKGILSEEAGMYRVFSAEKMKTVSGGKLDRDSIFFLLAQGRQQVSRNQFLKGRFICNVKDDRYCMEKITKLVAALERSDV